MLHKECLLLLDFNYNLYHTSYIDFNCILLNYSKVFHMMHPLDNCCCNSFIPYPSQVILLGFPLVCPQEFNFATYSFLVAFPFLMAFLITFPSLMAFLIAFPILITYPFLIAYSFLTCPYHSFRSYHSFHYIRSFHSYYYLPSYCIVDKI